MMKLSFKIILTPFLIATAVYLLVSCSPKNAKLSSAPAATTAAPSAPGTSHGEASTSGGASSSGTGSSPTRVTGTTDSGGGTGVENRVFESYVKDPTQLPAFTRYVQPLLKNIKAKDPTKPTQYERIFKMRSWYFAPIELEKIQKNTLGVSFMSSDTQQIARQTMEQVWIDSRIFFDHMNLKEQSELLVHEFVMTLYFMRFVSFDDLCKAGKVAGFAQYGESDCDENAASLKDAFPPEPQRPMTKQDYENIQFVTVWLLQNAQAEIKESEFIKMMYLKGFDKRFFNPRNFERDPKTHESNGPKISREEVQQALKKAELTGFTPDICNSTDDKTKVACKVRLTLGSSTYFNTEQTTLRLEFFRGNQTLKSMTGTLPSQDNYEAQADTITAENYWLVPVFETRAKVKVGERFEFAFLLLKESKSLTDKTPILNSIVQMTGVIVSTDKNKEPFCKTSRIKPTTPFEDGLIAYTDPESRLGSEKFFLSVSPLILCGPGQID